MALFDEPVSDDQPDETPEEDVEEEPVEQELVRIRLDGKILMVTPEVADAIQAREAASQKRFSEQGAELGRLRAQSQPVTQPVAPDPADEDLEFYKSPSKAWAAREAKLREEFDQALTQRETLAENRKAYWSKFYTDNQEFVGREKLVQAVVASEYDRLARLDPEEAQHALAEHLHGLLGTEPGEKPVKTTLSNRKVIAERSGNPPAKGSQPPAKSKQMTLSASINAMAEERRRALYNIKSEK